jgi:hypothetical protein
MSSDFCLFRYSPYWLRFQSSFNVRIQQDRQAIKCSKLYCRVFSSQYTPKSTLTYCANANLSCSCCVMLLLYFSIRSDTTQEHLQPIDTQKYTSSQLRKCLLPASILILDHPLADVLHDSYSVDQKFFPCKLVSSCNKV